LACQLVEICCINAFVFGVMTPLFLALNYMGWLRIDASVEEEGMDSSVHGGTAQIEFFHAAYYEAKRAAEKNGTAPPPAPAGISVATKPSETAKPSETTLPAAEVSTV